MIARLTGKLLEKSPNHAVVDCSGVGYAVTMPVSALSQLPEPGGDVSLHIYTYVREDTLALYGFLSGREKAVFEKLITVNGVGPRLAVSVLSGLPLDELLAVIASGDAKSLTRIPGVGRKTGERIILELREKLDSIEGGGAAAAATRSPAAAIEQDVVSAMLNLGCSQDAAERAVAKAREDGAPLEFDPLFRKALELVRR